MSLFEEKEQVLQHTIRVLVYPNITFQKDLEKDSYIQVIKKQIKLLNEIRSDLWFYLILPCHVPSLDFHNVTQLYTDFEQYPPTMRSHFSVKTIRKMFSNKLDIDLIMSHLPEHTHQLTNTLYNTTHHVPPVFGYSHWFDLKEVVAWPKDSFLQNITGLLEYDRCYLNTQHQKNMVLKQAAKTFNEKTIQKLDTILTVQHLGVDEKDIVSEINETPNKTIVFNHRPDTYKNFKGFMKVCDDLWELRKDFQVWIPLLDKPNREYVITTKGNKEWYYKQLQSCYVGFSPRQTYGGWSVATTDGMMNGIPYIMYDDTYYHELMKTADFFTSDHEAVMLLNTYLDDPLFRNEQASRALDWVESDLIYKKEIVAMSEYMNDLLSRQKTMSHSPKLLEIIEYIKASKKSQAPKLDLMNYLNWGRGIKWSPYRRALMNHSNIYDVNDSEPIYCWKDS